MSTVADQTGEQLESLIVELSTDLARLRRRHAEIEGDLAQIASEVRRGHPGRANAVSDLIREQDELKHGIATSEVELGAAQAQLERERENTRKWEIEKLFERMRARRARIVELAREMSLLLGELQSKDREQGSKLVPMTLGSLTQQEFVNLLEPITPYDREWHDRHQPLPVGFEHTVKVSAFVKIG